MAHGVIANLSAKLQLLVNELDKAGLLKNGQYTFPDGDIWKPEDTTTQIRIKIEDMGEVKEELRNAQTQLVELQRLLNLMTLHFESESSREH